MTVRQEAAASAPTEPAGGRDAGAGGVTGRTPAADPASVAEAVLAHAGMMAQLGAWWIEISNPQDLDSNPLRWSEEVYRIFGYAPGEVEVSNDLFFRHVHADDRQRVIDAVARALAAGERYAVEHRIVRRDGVERTVLEHGQAQRDAAGRLLRIVGAVQDITERKRMEDELRESEERARRRTAELQAVLDAMPAAVFITRDAGARSMEGNGLAFDALRVPRGAEVSKTAPLGVSKVSFRMMRRGVEIPPDELPMQRAARGEEVRGGELDLHFEDGEVRCYLGNATPIRDADGRCAGAIGAFVDVTTLRRSEQALRESEQRYRTMGETLPYGVWLCDAEGGSEYVSQSFLDLLEMTHEEQRQFGWTHRLPPEDVQAMLERWLHCVRTGTPWDSEHRVLGPDGKYHHVLTRGLPVRDQDGKITCWVGINLDIDERKRMEEELREADRRKTEFLAVLSHELRNPLAPIRNSIALLDRLPPASEQAARAREVIARQTNHLTKLVDDLLDLTRISHGKVELGREIVDLRELVRRTRDDHRGAFEERGVDLRFEDPARPVFVSADPTRLAQVVGNLLQNAAKFTARGGSTVIRIAQAAERAEIRVRDDGVGMDPEQVTRMFEPFTQADGGLARTTGGLGLGLALVKGLLELHGGTVSAHSDGLGRGSEFVLELPLAADPAASEARSPQPPAVRSRRIVLIEDNVDAAQTLADLLELDGHRVEVAHDAASGMRLARAARPDFVICDVGLPDLSGHEVARRLRADGQLARTRLIALTGYAQPEDRRRAAEAGFDAHLAKPPPLEELGALLAAEPGA